MESRDSLQKKILVATNLTNANGRSQLAGIIRHLERHQHRNLMIVGAGDDLTQEITNSRAEGFIVGSPISDEACRALAQTKRPTVLIDIAEDRLSPRTKELAFVHNDNVAIGTSAARYFLSLGNFRAHGYVPAERKCDWCEKRCQAYRRVLAEAKRPVKVFSGHNPNALAAWLVRLPKPAAVFASHDFRALQTVDAALSAGLKIPSQVSILGVDDDELICNAANPSLSSIRLDSAEKGVRAAVELDRLLNGRKATEVRTVICPISNVTERESTRTPAPATTLIRRAREIIATEATSGITPDDMAKRLGVSRRLLYLRFREAGEKTIAHLLAKRKLEVFHSLLGRSAQSVNSLAARCGFSNVNSLRNVYRRTYGKTISQSRKARQTKKWPKRIQKWT